MKKALSMLLCLVMLLSLLPTAGFAEEGTAEPEEIVVDGEVATVSDQVMLAGSEMYDVLTSATSTGSPYYFDNGVYLKQASGSEQCTLVSNVMMLRRRAYLENDPKWSSITIDSVGASTWTKGMAWNFTYNGKTVNSYGLQSELGMSLGDLDTLKNYLIQNLQTHPEGIVIYVHHTKSYQHAVLLTDYDASTGTFYCADPAPGIASGRIPLAESLLPSYVKKSYPNTGLSDQDLVIAYTQQTWMIIKGQGEISPQTPGTHTHDKGTYVFYEAAHPHCNCYKCSICGEIWRDTSETNYLSSCDECNPQNSTSGTCGAQGSNLTWHITGDTLNISGSGDMANFAEKETPWYEAREQIKSLQISDGVTSIGNYAFCYLTNLTSVSLADSITSIGQFAFAATGLTSIAFPNNLHHVAKGVISFTNITTVTIPVSLTIIDDDAFGGAVSLSNVRYQGTEAMRNSLTGNGWSKVGNSYFYNATWQYLNNFNYTVAYNANGGTGAPGNQTKTYNVTLTLSSIRPSRSNASAGSYTVTLNANGGSVSPASLTAARTTNYSFNNWNTAQNGSGTSYAPGASYTANATVTLYAQWNSSTTTAAVTLPTPTRSGYSFQGWSTSSSATSGMTGSYTPDGNVTLYATWKAAPTYGNCGAQGSNVTWYISQFGSDTLYILGSGDMADYSNYNDQPWRYRRDQIKQVYVSDGVTSIGVHAFSNFGNLGHISIADSVTRIGEGAFSVTGLKGITLPKNLVTIGDLAFANSPLESIIFPENVQSIGQYLFAFFYTSPLKSVTIPRSLTNIAGYAFVGTDNLTNVRYYGTAAMRNSLTDNGWSTSGNNTFFNATWEYVNYTVSYDANGGTGAPASQKKTPGTALTLSRTVPTREGYSFLWWTDSDGDIYYPGGSYAKDASTTMTAAWGRLGAEMSAGAGRTLLDGDYEIRLASHRYALLDVSGAAVPAEEGENVQLWINEDTVPTHDAWTIRYLDNGFYAIFQKGTNLALSVADDSVALTANIQMNAYTGKHSQQWSIEPAYHGDTLTGLRLLSRASGLAVDVSGYNVAAYTNIMQWEVNNEGAQSWVFIPYVPARTVADGRYILLSAMSDTLELDVAGDTGDIPNGHNVQVWNDNNEYFATAAASQYNSFDVEYLGGGYYKLIHAASGKALSVSESNTAYYQNVCVSDYTGSPTQQWAIVRDGETYVLISKYSGYSLDVLRASTEDGANVVQYGNHTSQNEHWKFVPAEYSVRYSLRGGSPAISEQVKYYKGELSLSTVLPEWGKHLFLGWASTPTATEADYQPGDTFTVDADTTLYAVWLDFSAPDGVLPGSLKRLEDEVLAGCAFRYVKLPEGASAIGSRVFDGSARLRAVYIPANVTNIAADAFDGAPEGLTIVGQEGSYAEFFAGKYGFAFVEG